MAIPKGSVLHQQALIVAGLFTGLTLTALVLVLSSPAAFRVAIGPLSGSEYLATVATYIAFVGSLSSVAMLMFLEIAGGLAQTFTLLDKLGTGFFLGSVFGFMGILPLLLVPFTRTGAAVVLGVEAALLTVYFVSRRVPRHPTDP